MHVKVAEVIGSEWTSYTEGRQLYELIAPLLNDGEPIELDFVGIRHTTPLFFNAALGYLIEHDTDDRLKDLLKLTNFPPMGEEAYESVVRFATRCRENPAWGDAMTAATLKWSERD